MCLILPLECKQAVILFSLPKLWIDNTSKIYPKYAPDRLFWTPKMQKLPGVGGHTLLSTYFWIKCVFSPPWLGVEVRLYFPNSTKVCTTSLSLNFKMQKLPGVGGGDPLPHPQLFSGFLDRRVMCLMHPRKKKASCELYFLLKFWIDSISKIHQKYAPDRLFWTLKNAKVSWCWRGIPPPPAYVIFW